MSFAPDAARPSPTAKRGGISPPKIELLYRAAADREDVEDIELEHMDTAYRTPHLHNGLLVHQPYTIYAHWILLRRLLAGAGVEHTQVHFDIDSTARGGLSVQLHRGGQAASFARVSSSSSTST